MHEMQVIDGGSTGSRLHIFEFRKDLTSNTTACIRQGSDRAQVPLSAFARTDSQIETNEELNATHVAQHLIPLFQYAANIIPSQYHALTSVHYQATAGMRLLEEYEQTLVYDALFAGFKESPDFVFTHLQRENIATLGGEEEALYGAVSANYLSGVVDVKLHMINKDGTVEDEDIEFDGPLGALDMGGASMQIVYLPHEEFEEDCDNYDHVHGDESASESESLVQHRTKTSKGLKELPNLPNRPNRLNGDEFFSTSYLSYGADQFRERLWDNWVEKRELDAEDDVFHTSIIDNPCSFNGYTSEWKGYTFVGSGDAKRCAKEVNRLIPHHKEPTYKFSEFRTVGGVTHPPIRGHFFAMSLFFFTLDCLRELSNHQGLNDAWPTPSISDLTQALDILCSRDWNDVSIYIFGLYFPNTRTHTVCIFLMLNFMFFIFRILHTFKTMLTSSRDLLFYRIDVSKACTW